MSERLYQTGALIAFVKRERAAPAGSIVSLSLTAGGNSLVLLGPSDLWRVVSDGSCKAVLLVPRYHSAWPDLWQRKLEDGASWAVGRKSSSHLSVPANVPAGRG
ncbi:hypothetical protein SKAU_G00073490 [Synaphobranchus kaupii]|uniref:Uncharacterized protein n=1 Tax=Synaphobranchus kaupii TaxID=118154 RepID=A0A9Q1J9R6_SYNKA|nr:hypothetical protein SKAU_G00073490 [Synaphobranchus kaupii]